MKYDKFFELAKQAGIEEAELYIGQSYSLSFELFHKEVTKYENNNGYTILARGLVNGKCGTASCDVWNNEKAAFLVNEIAKNAKVIENDDPVFIFKGSDKYKKVNTFNKELPSISIDEKMAKLYELEDAIRAQDKRIVEVQSVEYEETMETTTIFNSNGLKLTQKSNYYVILGAAVARQGDQTKSGYDLILDNDFSKINVQELAKKISDETVSQLGGEPPMSGEYKVVLAPDVVSSLMKYYVNYASADEVQKHSSLFIGQLGKKVGSSKVTIEEKPLAKGIYARWFDDEGVATSNKFIIKNGVLQTFLYNLTTAAKEGVTTTGNGYRAGGKMGVSTGLLCMKPGKKSLEELFQEVGEGIYVTDVSGLHAGLNAQSGNFSLQSTGFLIKDGKKDRPLDIITVQGNLLTLFKDVVSVGSNLTLRPNGTQVPSVVIKKLAIGGK